MCSVVLIKHSNTFQKIPTKIKPATSIALLQKWHEVFIVERRDFVRNVRCLVRQVLRRDFQRAVGGRERDVGGRRRGAAALDSERALRIVAGRREALGVAARVEDVVRRRARRTGRADRGVARGAVRSARAAVAGHVAAGARAAGEALLASGDAVAHPVEGAGRAGVGQGLPHQKDGDNNACRNESCHRIRNYTTRQKCGLARPRSQHGAAAQPHVAGFFRLDSLGRK